jgi:hypothetical protein
MGVFILPLPFNEKEVSCPIQKFFRQINLTKIWQAQGAQNY